MKTGNLFLMSVLSVLSVFTACDRNDSSVVPQTLNNEITIIPPKPGDTLDPGTPTGLPPFEWDTTQSGQFLRVFIKSCTGTIIGFNVPDEFAGCRSRKGVCVATHPDPSTSDILGYTEDRGIRVGDRDYNSMSCVDGLQPATEYFARAWYTTGDETFYTDKISFSTNARPVVMTLEAIDITSTTAVLRGNIISTGGSFVVEKGVCCSYGPEPNPYGTDPYIEQEVQSGYVSGEFSIQMTGLTPGKLYYARAFMGVATGIEYGDQLFAFGDEITFTTK